MYEEGGGPGWWLRQGGVGATSAERMFGGTGVGEPGEELLGGRKNEAGQRCTRVVEGNPKEGTSSGWQTGGAEEGVGASGSDWRSVGHTAGLWGTRRAEGTAATGGGPGAVRETGKFGELLRTPGRPLHIAGGED